MNTLGAKLFENVSLLLSKYMIKILALVIIITACSVHLIEIHLLEKENLKNNQ